MSYDNIIVFFNLCAKILNDNNFEMDGVYRRNVRNMSIEKVTSKIIFF